MTEKKYNKQVDTQIFKRDKGNEGSRKQCYPTHKLHLYIFPSTHLNTCTNCGFYKEKMQLEERYLCRWW